MRKIFLIPIFSFFCICALPAQELKAIVNINSSQISGSSKSAITTLQTAMDQLINGTKWTESNFATNEKIDCTFNIVLKSVSDDNYSGEIQVTASRPVYNASYVTPTFNFRDVEFSFSYTEGENLEYTPNSITNNLIAVISFYTYIIIGLDYDSFALNGGTPYFQTAMQIVTAMQNSNYKGWAAFQSNHNRYALALGLTQKSMDAFHELWYMYHRLGLDDMSNNVERRGRRQISDAIALLPKLKETNTTTADLLVFGDTKIDEIAKIFGSSTSDDKKAIYKILNDLFPTKSAVLDNLKQ